MTIVIILFAAFSVPACYAIWRLIKRMQRKAKQKKLALAYEQLVLQNSLRPERYEIVSDSVIALDRKNKILAFIDTRKATVLQYVISLRMIGETKIVEERNAKGNIQKIALQLIHKGSGRVYSICFFDAAHDPVTELTQLAKKALSWQISVNRHKRSGFWSMEQEYIL